jgi:beta-mannosidase
MSRTRFSLSSGWQWKLANANGNEHANKNTVLQHWQLASQFPSVIQLELLHTKQIPDPNIGENERLIQWVGEVDWVYRTSFRTPTHTGQSAKLVFEGLDTFATVTLNGENILKSNNMFLPARIDIKHLLKRAGEENVLEIMFESALKKGTELEKEYGERTSMMRDKRRMQMRKAQVSPHLWLSLLIYLTSAVSLGLGLGPYYCYVWSISPDIPGHLRFPHRRPLHHLQFGF